MSKMLFQEEPGIAAFCLQAGWNRSSTDEIAAECFKRQRAAVLGVDGDRLEPCRSPIPGERDGSRRIGARARQSLITSSCLDRVMHGSDVL